MSIIKAGGSGGAERPMNVIVKGPVWAVLKDSSGTNLGTATNPIYVDGISGGTAPLPTGAATAANQTTEIGHLATIAGDTTSLDGKVTACNTGAVVVSSSALPTGASTAANQATEITHLATIAGDTTSLDGKVTTCNTGAVTVAASALPAGAATESTLNDVYSEVSDINSKMVTGTDIGDVTINNAVGAAAVNIQDGGNIITVDGSVDVGTVTTLPAITGTVTANAGTNLNTSALALETTLSTLSGNVTTCNTGAVTVAASALPTGAATAALQTSSEAILTTIDSVLDAIKDTDGIKKITDAVAVTTVKPDGTNTMPSLDAAARAGYVMITDGTDRVGVLKDNDSFTLGTDAGLAIGFVDTSLKFRNIRGGPSTGDGYSTAYQGQIVQGMNWVFTGSTWARHRGANLYFDVQGASALAMIAATVAKKHRIYSMVLSADTNGLVTINDGIGRFYMLASTPVSINFGVQGKLQTTANTALTITNAGGGNVACCGTYSDE